jgi:NAD+ kinase
LKVGVVSRTDKPKVMEVVRCIVGHLESRGSDVLIEKETALSLGIPGRNVDLRKLKADLLVTVGGDGTILRTAMLIPDPSTPILGVNMGSRGFLTEVSPRDVKQALDKVLNGDYAIEECIKLSSKSLNPEVTFPDSLNEVLVASSRPSKMLDLRLSVDGVRLIDIQADGAIVAPPTGSTAYNLSAGGSILSPGVEAMILTTTCPYSYFRSIVVPTSSRISIGLLKPNVDALAIIDGRDYTPLKPGSTVEVWKSSHRARFVRFKPFYEKLERRLTFRRVQ